MPNGRDSTTFVPRVIVSVTFEIFESSKATRPRLAAAQRRFGSTATAGGWRLVGDEVLGRRAVDLVLGPLAQVLEEALEQVVVARGSDSRVELPREYSDQAPVS